MAILEVGPDYSKGWGSEEDGTSLAVTEYYKVITDGEDSAPIVRNAYGVPAMGHVPTYEPGVVLTRKTARAEDERNQLWVVECTYTNATSSSSLDPNPLARPVLVETETISFMRPIDTDINDEPIVTTTDEYPEPFPEVEDFIFLVRFIRNELYLDVSTVIAYLNRLNTYSWYGVPEKCAKCSAIKSQGQTTEGSYTYEPIVYEFQIAADPIYWKYRFLNQGYYVKDGSNRKPALVGGLAPSRPVLLTEAGAILPIGGTPHIMEYEIRQTADFNALGLV